MHRYLRMIKSLLVTVSSAEFKTISLNSKLSKVLSYTQYNEVLEMIYVLLKILFNCLRFCYFIEQLKKGMDKVFYYSRITKIPIFKSSSDLDNEELFPVSISSSFKVCILSDNDTE